VYHFQPLTNNNEANARFAKAASTLTKLWNSMDLESRSAVFAQINAKYNLNSDLISHEICMKTLEHNLNNHWTDFI